MHLASQLQANSLLNTNSQSKASKSKNPRNCSNLKLSAAPAPKPGFLRAPMAVKEHKNGASLSLGVQHARKGSFRLRWCPRKLRGRSGPPAIGKGTSESAEGCRESVAGVVGNHFRVAFVPPITTGVYRRRDKNRHS